MKRYLALFVIIPSVVLSSFVIRKKQGLLIVFIGDSITYGGGLENPGTEAPPVATCDGLRKLPGIRRLVFSNQGVSGFTTVDFLPATATVFNKIIRAADDLTRENKGLLLFSIMLGTNDSAIEGPNGSPVSPASYRENLKTIADSLLKTYPGCKIVINRPVWYSPNTYNGAKYLEEGLQRLQSYFPEIDRLVSGYGATDPGRVYAGDKKAFDYFEMNYRTDLQTEQGRKGDFFLHPNKKGAAALGRFWADAIYSAVK